MISIIDLEKWTQPMKTFRGLGRVNLGRLCETGQLESHKRGELLWRNLDRADRFVFVLEGTIEVVAYSREGQACLLGIFGPGDVCGLSAVTQKGRFPATAVCGSRQARVIRFSIPSLDSAARQDKDTFLIWQQRVLFEHEQALRDKIAVSSSGTLEERLLELFCRLGRRFPPSKPKFGTTSISIPLTKTQIAKLVDARVETVIRTLRAWEKKNLLSMGKCETHISTQLFGSSRPCDEPRAGTQDLAF